jgi:hypothetical protein
VHAFEVTPAKDLELLINNVRGRQDFDFLQGKRMSRIEAVFPLTSTTILSTVTKPLITIPPTFNKAQVSKAPENQPQVDLHDGQLAVGRRELRQARLLQIRSSIVVGYRIA